MTVDYYLFLLAGLYLAFLMLGGFFYFATARANAMKWSAGNRVLKVFRFTMYVLLLPVSLTFATALYLVYAEYISFL